MMLYLKLQEQGFAISWSYTHRLTFDIPAYELNMSYAGMCSDKLRVGGLVIDSDITASRSASLGSIVRYRRISRCRRV